MTKIKRILKLTKAQRHILMTVAVAALLMAALAVTASANTGGTSPQGFELNFDVTAMFSWAQTIISALMPVVYITMGLGLGFLIINALKQAFR